MSTTTWKKLGSVPPKELSEARVQLHYAVQLAAAVGCSLLDAEPDDSHRCFNYDNSLHALTGAEIPGDQSFHVSLDVSRLQLGFRGAESQVFAEVPLAGQTLSTGLTQVNKIVHELAPAAPAIEIRAAGMEDHKLARGAPFDVEAQHLAEIDRYYHNTLQLLERIKHENIGSSRIRVWPHHLEMAMLIAVDEGDHEDGKAVSVGLCLGDDRYREPYFYVAPYPDPNPVGLPHLETPGHWTSEGPTAAILTATELLEASNRQGRAVEFLGQLVVECEQLLTH